MSSIFSKILTWVAATVLVSLAGLLATSAFVSARLPGKVDFFARAQKVQLNAAREAYERGGRGALAAFLRRQDSDYHARHFLVDRRGVDLVDGTDRSRMVARAGPPAWPPLLPRGPLVIVRTSDDGAHRLLIELPPPFGPLQFLPYFLWFLAVIVALGYLLAVNLARPLRALKAAVERFGRGDLEVRFRSDRRDEIGQLGRAFDRMAERIETLLTAERRLLQDVSHELRSPLTRLIFALELARTAPDREAALSRASKEAGRLTELVDELLSLTRTEGDPAARVREPVPLGPLVRGLAEDCSLEAARRGGSIVLDADPDVVVLGDPELIRRAVENALRNAIRHSPDGEAVDLRVSRVDGSARIVVRDRGPGVAPEHLDDLFKPFFRVEADRDRESGGVGLGLAIARRAVGLHQGRIRASNADPGLAITIDLPASSTDVAGSATANA
ncbi:Sensor protein CpxA [Aquisphaera giovannonii]|uniref:histidine kinase n=1 Tax=Aquisphaera giovannonii TaxID=406548 RepID=A0A5B9WBY3_9BACT|nr:ATP-binding protein [Aquisphaera giovannonii]QEH37390.1 Sensor protein CpxA [Aquisphaera giovannonii]